MRGIVSHDVVHPGNEECLMAVAVPALVHASNVAQVGGGTFTGDSALAHVGKGRGVVRAIGDGSIGEVVRSSHQTGLGYQDGLLKVAVGHASLGVVR